MRRVPTLLLCLAFSTAVACAHEPGAGTATTPAAASSCPAAVNASIAKEFPGATTTSCKVEHEDGREQYEVKVNASGGENVEVDVAPDGAILQMEQPILLEQLPARVLTAFGARYPGAKPTRAEKQVRTGKGTFYEIAFASGAKAREATFAEDGTFVEEE
jgi:uncharacterized membrane protein YkoI